MEICFNTARVVFSLYIYQAWLNSISCFFWLLVTLLIAVLFFFFVKNLIHIEKHVLLFCFPCSLSLCPLLTYTLYTFWNVSSTYYIIYYWLTSVICASSFSLSSSIICPWFILDELLPNISVCCQMEFRFV